MATREQKVRSKTVAGIKSLWNSGPETLTTRLQISDCDAAAPALTKPPNMMVGSEAQARINDGNFGRKDGILAVEIQEGDKARGKGGTTKDGTPDEVHYFIRVGSALRETMRGVPVLLKDLKTRADEDEANLRDPSFREELVFVREVIKYLDLIMDNHIMDSHLEWIKDKQSKDRWRRASGRRWRRKPALVVMVAPGQTRRRWTMRGFPAGWTRRIRRRKALPVMTSVV